MSEHVQFGTPAGGTLSGTYPNPSLDASFTDLNDVPHSYSGQANKAVTVKGDQSGLEFTTMGSGTIGGTIDTNQVAFGTALNTIGGSDNFTWNNSSTGILSLKATDELQYNMEITAGAKQRRWIFGIGVGVSDGSFAWRDETVTTNRITIATTGAVGFNAITSPTALVHIPADDSGDNIPSLKINSGSMISPQAGAIENDGTHLYYTDDTNARYQLDQQGGAPASPFNSIQFNQGGVFGGTNDFKLENDHTVSLTNPNGQVVIGHAITLATDTDIVCYGLGNTAAGSGSVSLGVNNTTNRSNSIAIGYNNSSPGTNGNGVAIGFGNTADDNGGLVAVAMGVSNSSLGQNGVAVGNSNTVASSGFDAVAMGRGNTANAEDGIAVGAFNQANAVPSLAFGTNNTVNNTFGVAFGWENTISADNALAYGRDITNSTAGSLQIGPSDAAKTTILSTGEVDFPDVILIAGGGPSAGYVWTATDGTGIGSWQPNSGIPASPDRSIQFNNSGAFGGDSGFLLNTDGTVHLRNSNGCVIIGDNGNVANTDDIILGINNVDNSTSGGGQNVIIGVGNTINPFGTGTNDHLYIFGNNNSVGESEENTFIIGQSNNIHAARSIFIGSSFTSDGDDLVFIGTNIADGGSHRSIFIGRNLTTSVVFSDDDDKIIFGLQDSGKVTIDIDGNVDIPGKLTVAGAIDPTALYLDEQGSNPSISSNKGVLFTKDSSGVTQLYYKADDSTVYQLTPTSSGTIGGSIAAGQMAFGSGTNTIAGSNDNTWNNSTKVLAINGTILASTKVGILESGSSPTKYTYFQAGDQTVDVTYTLPTDAPVSNGYVLSSTTAGVLSWANPSGIGAVTSVSNSDSTLTISPTTGNVIASLNLSHANSWGALQTFGNNISLGGATLSVTSLTTNNLIQYNGTNWVNVAPAALGLANSVSNSDSSLTISPTTGSVVASINLAHINIWTVDQKFNTKIGILEGGSSPTKYTYLQGGDQAADITLTLPTALAAGNGYVLSSTTGGVLSWIDSSAVGAVSSVANSDGTLTISPTTGNVVASLALGHANTWTALQTLTLDDAVTNAITNILTINHSSSGTPAANFGTGILLTGESTTTDNRSMIGLQAFWTTATDASRASAFRIQTVTGAAALATALTVGPTTLTFNNPTTNTILDWSNSTQLNLTTGNFMVGNLSSPDAKTEIYRLSTDSPTWALRSSYGTAATNTISSSFALRTISTGSMANGFGGGIVFQLRDTDNVDNNVCRLAATRNGADNTGKFQFDVATAGSLATKLTILDTNQVGIQQTSPTALLHLGAGTASASTAPIKLTSGTSLTSAEAGAVEFTTDDLFFTITTSTARKRLLMADASGGLTSGRVPFATTNGRLLDTANLTWNNSTNVLAVTGELDVTGPSVFTGTASATALVSISGNDNGVAMLKVVNNGNYRGIWGYSQGGDAIYAESQGSGTASIRGYNTISDGIAVWANQASTGFGVKQTGASARNYFEGIARFDGTIGILETGASPSKYTYLQGGDQSADITYTLPTVLPAASGYALTSTTGGVMSWAKRVSISDTVALTGQTADITTTNFAGVTAPGTYRVNYSLLATSADLTAGAVQLTIAFTDAAGATTITSSNLVLTALGRSAGVGYIQLASGNISYAVAHTGIFGTATYALYMTLERLS